MQLSATGANASRHTMPSFIYGFVYSLMPVRNIRATTCAHANIHDQLQQKADI